MTQKLAIVYFAWVKERLGRNAETIDLPDTVATVSQLIEYLLQGDEIYRPVFDDLSKLRFALDQNFVQLDARLDGARELAIFPPVTGG